MDKRLRKLKERLIQDFHEEGFEVTDFTLDIKEVNEAIEPGQLTITDLQTGKVRRFLWLDGKFVEQQDED